MNLSPFSSAGRCFRLTALAMMLGGLAAAWGQQPKKVTVLMIGTSGDLGDKKSGGEALTAIDTLHDFIKTETGFQNEIHRQSNYLELAQKLTEGKLHIGVFEGYEFAWAQEKYPKLKPLAIAVNVYRYSVVDVVARKDNPARTLADLKGTAIAIPNYAVNNLNLYIDHECRKVGLEPKRLFSSITHPKNNEAALDDVVDGKVQAAAIDRVGVEGYKRRKPGRFNHLKELVHSPELPPPVIAYAEGVLDQQTLRRFRDGLIQSSRKEKGRSLLAFFKLTGFEVPPADFDRVLVETRKDFPPLKK